MTRSAGPVGPRPVEVAPGVTAREVAALEELDRSWSEIQAFLQAVLLGDTTDVVAEELLVFPGLEELVSLRALRRRGGLRRVRPLRRRLRARPGSTLRLLRLPDVLRTMKDNFWDMKRRAARALRPVADRVGAGPIRGLGRRSSTPSNASTTTSTR